MVAFALDLGDNMIVGIPSENVDRFIAMCLYVLHVAPVVQQFRDDLVEVLKPRTAVQAFLEHYYDVDYGDG